MASIGNFRALDSFRGRFKRPGNQRARSEIQSRLARQQTHNPVRDFQERKYLRRNLSYQPADHGVRDRDLVNVAPLQLGEEDAPRSFRTRRGLGQQFLEPRIFADRVPHRIVL